MGAKEEPSYSFEIMVDRPKRAAPEEWDLLEAEMVPQPSKRRLVNHQSSYTEADVLLGRQVMDVLGSDGSLIDDGVLQLLSIDTTIPELGDPLLIFDEPHETSLEIDVLTPALPMHSGGYEVFLQDESLFVGAVTTGPWRLEEEKLLLHIMYTFIDAELRTMAVVAWKCGIHRPKRAIDKKIKRTLRFSKWRERDIPSAQSEILRLLREKTFAALPQSQYDCLAAVRVELQRLGLPSFELLPRDACLDQVM
ncbi:Hypothetical Protein FCC1311_092832 [Hondaea fermentalgiana]|uniref:Uncharacterized protein n=1 Tax=Hondaea fermentalgiana TaxID=2315210 RepID=A0A2R5GRY0_9STRA|nr:Hypothetical Protein FCC1311_092832 [Hondaea fermentalgiana]|eukprot:GBG33059.1 Hypothetical Protein FCC1311_092832 [Hondaea fermentalgiana]